MDVWRDTLTNVIRDETGFQASTAFTIDQLKQLYEASLQGPQAFNALLKSLKETNMALWETGKAADVAYGALLPSSHGIPKGGRSGKMRVRSDYVRPLIGGPETIRQMMSGARPKEFARGSAEIAALAAKIDIGDKMVKQGDKYAQGVGKMTTANTNLKTSLGNMPASLIPGAKSLPNDVKPATTAIAAMNKALASIPKQITPKVTAQVTGQSAVAAMQKALKNIPKSVTTQLRVYPVSSNPASRFYKRPSQHGYMGTVKRPTVFLAGEGGRYEDIRITPRGSRGGGAGGGGGRDIYIGPIYLGGEKIIEIIRYKMTENSSIFR